MTRRTVLVLLALLVVLLAGLGGYAYWRLTPGLAFQLVALDALGLQVGAPVQYRGVTVGRVIATNLAPATGDLQIGIAVDRSYVQLMRQSSVFWIARGASPAVASSAHVNVETPSAAGALITGGQIVQGAASALDAQIQLGQARGEQELQARLQVQDLRLLTRLEADGTVSRTLAIEIGTLIPEQLLLGSLVPNTKPWTTEILPLPDGKIVRATGNFHDSAQASWRGSTIILRRESGLLTEDMVFEETAQPSPLLIQLVSPTDQTGKAPLTGDKLVEWGRQLLSGESSLGQVMGQAADAAVPVVMQELSQAAMIPAKHIGVQMTIDMPGKIVESNATIQAGSRASWTLSGEEVQRGLRIFVRARRILWARAIVVGLALAVVLTIIVALITRRSPVGRSGVTLYR
jgi:hypothetical protein